MGYLWLLVLYIVVWLFLSCLLGWWFVGLLVCYCGFCLFVCSFFIWLPICFWLLVYFVGGNCFVIRFGWFWYGYLFTTSGCTGWLLSFDGFAGSLSLLRLVGVLLRVELALYNCVLFNYLLLVTCSIVCLKLGCLLFLVLFGVVCLVGLVFDLFCFIGLVLLDVAVYCFFMASLFVWVIVGWFIFVVV